MKRRHFLKTSGAAFAGLMAGAPPSFASAAKENPNRRPNILYIMADDHDASLVGAYEGCLKDFVQSPNIDRIGREGARLTHCFCTNSLCVPSRATILTGQYSHKTGVYTLREDLNTKDTPTSASVLHDAGYQTAVVGKWHLHGDNKYGFDYYAVTHSQGSYINPTLATPEGKRHEEGHTSDVYTDISLEWLGKRDKSRPFFLMHHFKATHGPWQYAPRYADLYKDVEVPEPPTLWDDYAHRDPNGVPLKQARIHTPGSKSSLSLWMSSNKKGKSGADWPTGKLDLSGMNDREITKATYQKYAKDYMRCVKGIDDNVGRLLKALEDEDVLDSTVVVYTSDQGMYVGEHGFYDKRLGLDEGMRMPFLVRYPKEIEAGQVLGDLVNNADFAPTLIDLGGEKVPEEMQGYSFWNNLRGEKPAHRREGTFYAFYSNGAPKHYGLRTRDYKLLKYVGKKTGEVVGMDLFDMQADPLETCSVVADEKYASVLALMEKKLAREMKDIDIRPDQMPGAWGGGNED